MHNGLINDLGIVTATAAFTGMIMRRLGQPSILGYLLAGLIVGPYIPIPLFASPERMQELAEVGVVLVMFAVGLEFRVGRLLEILPISGLTAAVQIGTLAWAGFSVGAMLGWTTTASICLGACLAISSTMVVSAVLKSSPVDPDVRSHVFGVLVVQDVVAIALMAVVTALAAGETVGLQPLGLLIGELTAVVAAMLIGALLILPRLVRSTLRQGDSETLVVLVVGAAFALAMLAGQFGYSVALGAFICGIAVAESGRGHDVELAIEPLRAIFSAIFFVSIGMTVDPVVAWGSLPLALILCAVVISMQFLSVTVATVLSGSSLRLGVHSGLALGQIGEMSFILATIAIAGGAVPAETLPALVTVATVTAFTTPFLLKRALLVVESLDHRLPDRAHQLLASYQAMVRRARAKSTSHSISRPAKAVLLDWLAIIVVLVGRHAIRPRIDLEFVVALNVMTAVLIIPFLIGLVRSGAKLVAGLRAVVPHSADSPSKSRAIEGLMLLAAVVVIGLPTLALMRPLVSGAWAEVFLALIFLVALLGFKLRLGSLNSEYTSGVARLAIEVAQRAATDDAPPVRASFVEGPLAGVDYETRVVSAGSLADGKTLAELEMRCMTGASVVAISRAGDVTVLPTGHERLQLDDIIAVTGSEEAIKRATAIIENEPQPDQPAVVT